MSKKIYQKPSMRVIELQHQPRLLAGSGYPGEVYAPGILPPDEMNRLA